MTELSHFGVQGMRWGVHKAKAAASSSKVMGKSSQPEKKPFFTPERKAMAKKAAIGVGILTLAAGTAYAGYALNKSGKLPLLALAKKSNPVAEKTIHKLMEEPTEIIVAARGRNVDFRFMKKGGLKDALHEYDLAGFQDKPNEFMTRYGKKGSEKIAARILDPEGRKDHSGRPISHDIIIPHAQAASIQTPQDILTKVWPKIKDEYDQLYNIDPIKNRFEGGV